MTRCEVEARAADRGDRTGQAVADGADLAALDGQVLDAHATAPAEAQHGIDVAAEARRVAGSGDDEIALPLDRDRLLHRPRAGLEADPPILALRDRVEDGLQVAVRRPDDELAAACVDDLGRPLEELLDRLLDRVARTADAPACEGDVVGVEVARVREALVEPGQQPQRLTRSLELEQGERGEASFRAVRRRPPRTVGVLAAHTRLVLPPLAGAVGAGARQLDGDPVLEHIRSTRRGPAARDLLRVEDPVPAAQLEDRVRKRSVAFVEHDRIGDIVGLDEPKDDLVGG